MARDTPGALAMDADPLAVDVLDVHSRLLLSVRLPGGPLFIAQFESENAGQWSEANGGSPPFRGERRECGSWSEMGSMPDGSRQLKQRLW